MTDFDPRDMDDCERDRWDDLERGRDPRDRDDEREPDDGRDAARDVFTRDLDLPDGLDRELVRVHEHVYELNGDDARALANIGAFRVVQARDLSDNDDGRAQDTLDHLKDEGLVQVIPMESRDRDIVALTEEGRELLVETHRDDREHAQEFYADAVKPRELAHDAHVYRAYLRTAERLEEEGARIDRVVLDYELKHEYQTFLQERNRDQSDSDGRPDRDAHEIEAWAREHDLPYFDEQVHFPDVRIEYDDVDGRHRHEDVEVMTGHYRGAHAAASARAGFTRYRIGGSTGRSGGRSFDPRVAEQFL
jgi:hypothetical protein